MTTAQVAPAPEEIRRRHLVAQRVRGLMGERRISGVRLAGELMLSQAAFSRRSTGDLAFSLDEIEQLASILGVDEAYLFGFSDQRARRDSNPKPSDWESPAPAPRAVEPVPALATVLPFRARLPHGPRVARPRPGRFAPSSVSA